MVNICVDIVQVDVEEMQGRKGRGRGAKQASTHTLLQVSQNPSTNPSMRSVAHVVQTFLISACIVRRGCLSATLKGTEAKSL